MKGDAVTTKNSQRNQAKKERIHDDRKRNGQNKNATVEITSGCFSGLKIELRKNATTFGSNIECDICLDHSFVSSEHARIIIEGRSYFLEDLNSRHGTSLNGQEIHKIKINDGDLIGIGNFILKFNLPAR